MRKLFAIPLLLLVTTVLVAEIGKKVGVVDKKFATVAGMLIGSTIVDVEGTFAVKNSLKNNPNFHFYEKNPMLRPFINAGRPAAYAVLGGMNTGIIALSYKMKKNANPTMRRLWWLPLVGMTGGHIATGAANLRFRPR